MNMPLQLKTNYDKDFNLCKIKSSLRIIFMKKEFNEKLLVWEIKISKEFIFMLRFILEGHEGLALAETIDPQNGILHIYVPQSQEKDLSLLLNSLNIEYKEIDSLE